MWPYQLTFLLSDQKSFLSRPPILIHHTRHEKEKTNRSSRVKSIIDRTEMGIRRQKLESKSVEDEALDVKPLDYQDVDTAGYSISHIGSMPQRLYENLPTRCRCAKARNTLV